MSFGWGGAVTNRTSKSDSSRFVSLDAPFRKYVRSKKPKTKIKKFWNSEKSILAGDKDQRLKANEQRAIEKLISFKASILDLGCGEGSLLHHLYLRNKVSSAIGVDFSRKHIGAAKKIKSKKNLLKKVYLKTSLHGSSWQVACPWA